MKSSAFAQLLLLGALWGAAFMFMRIAAPEFGAVPMAASRVLLAVTMMLAALAWLRQSLQLRRYWRRYLVIGAVNTAIPFIAYSYAARHIPAGYSAIANSTTPVWAALIAWAWLREPLGARKWIGIVCAFAGVFLLVGLQPVALTGELVLGMALVVLAASLYATASFLIKRYLAADGNDPANGGLSQLAGATGMVLGASVWLALPGVLLAPAAMPSGKAWAAVFALALFCTAAGYFLFFSLIGKIGPQRASSVAFLFPVFAAFWGWLVLDEPITANMAIGMAVVLLGTALVSHDGSAAATRTGAATTGERIRDWLLWPLVYSFCGTRGRRAIADRFMHDARYFREEVQALRANVPQLLPDADLDRAAADHRLTRLVDRADVFLSALRQTRTLQRDIVVTGLPPVEQGAMILFAHYGNGWWTLPVLAAQGKPVSLVSAPFPKLIGWRQWLWWPYLRLRWREMNRLGGTPLITMRGASNLMRERLAAGGRGLAAIDIPPALAKRTAPVPFFGRTAHMARRAIELANETGAALYVFFGEVDRDSLQQRVSFEPISLAAGVDTAYADYAARLERHIRARPGLWHAWGDVALYFEAPQGTPELL